MMSPRLSYAQKQWCTARQDDKLVSQTAVAHATTGLFFILL